MPNIHGVRGPGALSRSSRQARKLLRSGVGPQRIVVRAHAAASCRHACVKAACDNINCGRRVAVRQREGVARPGVACVVPSPAQHTVALNKGGVLPATSSFHHAPPSNGAHVAKIRPHFARTVANTGRPGAPERSVGIPVEALASEHNASVISAARDLQAP